MVKRTGILMLAVAAVGLTLASAGDAQAFFGRRGGSEGSSGGCSGSYGSSGGSSGSYGSHGGRLFRHRHSGGSCGDSSSCCESSCDSGGESSSCGCSDSASNTAGNEHVMQAADRDERGERHEAGYNSETRIDTNRPMPAPEYGERRGDNDRQTNERVSESRDQSNNDRDAKTSPRSNNDSKIDNSSDQKKQE